MPPAAGHGAAAAAAGSTPSNCTETRPKRRRIADADPSVNGGAAAAAAASAPLASSPALAGRGSQPDARDLALVARATAACAAAAGGATAAAERELLPPLTGKLVIDIGANIGPPALALPDGSNLCARRVMIRPAVATRMRQSIDHAARFLLFPPSRAQARTWLGTVPYLSATDEKKSSLW